MIGLPVHALAATRCTARTVSGACSSAACVAAHSSACCDSAEPLTLTTIPGTSLPAPSARAGLDGQPLSAKRRTEKEHFRSLHTPCTKPHDPCAFHAHTPGPA